MNAQIVASHTFGSLGVLVAFALPSGFFAAVFFGLESFLFTLPTAFPTCGAFLPTAFPGILLRTGLFPFCARLSFLPGWAFPAFPWAPFERVMPLLLVPDDDPYPACQSYTALDRRGGA